MEKVQQLLYLLPFEEEMIQADPAGASVKKNAQKDQIVQGISNPFPEQLNPYGRCTDRIATIMIIISGTQIRRVNNPSTSKKDAKDSNTIQEPLHSEAYMPCQSPPFGPSWQS